MRGPITEHVLTYARGKMPGGFVNIAGTTAHVPRGIGSFTPNIVPILKDEKTNFISMLFTITFSKMANFFLHDNRKRTKVRYF